MLTPTSKSILRDKLSVSHFPDQHRVRAANTRAQQVVSVRSMTDTGGVGSVSGGAIPPAAGSASDVTTAAVALVSVTTDSMVVPVGPDEATGEAGGEFLMAAWNNGFGARCNAVAEGDAGAEDAADTTASSWVKFGVHSWPIPPWVEVDAVGEVVGMEVPAVLVLITEELGVRGADGSGCSTCAGSFMIIGTTGRGFLGFLPV
jgi:hypothetical protein